MTTWKYFQLLLRGWIGLQASDVRLWRRQSGLWPGEREREREAVGGQSLGLLHRLRGRLATEGTDEWRTLCYSAAMVYEGVGFQLSHAWRM